MKHKIVHTKVVTELSVKIDKKMAIEIKKMGKNYQTNADRVLQRMFFQNSMKSHQVFET